MWGFWASLLTRVPPILGVDVYRDDADARSYDEGLFLWCCYPTRFGGAPPCTLERFIASDPSVCRW